MTDLADFFARHKYAVCRSCLKDPDLSLLYRYACRLAEIGTMTHDPTVPTAWSASRDFFMGGLLIDLLPLAEEVSGLKLFPTYSYFRVYKRGDVLKKHTDRPSREISVTLCLGYQAERPWPILIEGADGISSIELAPGDGMFYRGIECAHWREPFDGERLAQVAQVLLNYVDQTGPYAEWKYDKKPGLPFIEPSLPIDGV